MKTHLPEGMLSLRGKITLLVGTITFLTALFVGVAGYMQSVRMAEENGLTDLQAEARVVAGRMSEAFRVTHQNAEIVSFTPPIEGLARAAENGGVDPLDGSTTELWRSRLERIFTALMAAHPEYTQVRLIGLADNGRELVRVNRTPLGFDPVTTEDLQEKGEEPYFAVGATLPFGDALSTRISLNREHGAIDPRVTPTMRTVIPVFTHDGERFGMLVINLDYETLVREMLEELAPRHRTILSTQDGDFAVYEPGTGIDGIHFRFEPDYESHPVLSRNADGQTFQIGAVSYASDIVHRSDSEDGLSLDVFVGQATEQMLAGALNLRTQSVGIAAILVAFSILATLLFAGGLTRPLRMMTDAVRQFGQKRGTIDLPIESRDEVGDLARAFADMSRDLEASELTMKTVFDNVADGLVVIDRYGTITTANPALCGIFGYEPHELIGQNVRVLMPQEISERHDDIMANYRATGTRTVIGQTVEVPGRTKTGETIPLELTVSEMLLGDEAYFCGLIRDITERKQMETMKDEFISTVNHELRTPLTSIHGSLSLLEHRLGDAEIDGKTRSFLSMARNSCDRLAHLVNDILDLEKIAAGRMEYRFEVLETDRLVKDIVDRHLGLAEQYGVQFQLELDSEDASIEVDPNRFNQALVNLLSNAAKYSPKGDTVIVRTARGDNGQVRVSVSDSGPGIPEDFRAKVFERFAQADSSATRKVGGTGLGLHITKNLLEAFGGSVSFDTTEGAGTTFHFRLPVWSDIETRNVSFAGR
jgi:PAS domain S-box-containing protein